MEAPSLDLELGNFLHRELTMLVSTADPDLCVETAMATGSPEQILREATRTLDLLVIGASRHGPIGSLFFGGVARGLLMEAHCPVMVVP